MSSINSSFKYTYGIAAGNLHMAKDENKYQLTFDWSYDALYFKAPNNVWRTLGTGEKTKIFEWDKMSSHEQAECITMLSYAKYECKDAFERTKVNQMLRSKQIVIDNGTANGAHDDTYGCTNINMM